LWGNGKIDTRGGEEDPLKSKPFLMTPLLEEGLLDSTVSGFKSSSMVKDFTFRLVMTLLVGVDLWYPFSSSMSFSREGGVGVGVRGDGAEAVVEELLLLLVVVCKAEGGQKGNPAK
jgi:hypothetical protein